MQRDKGKPIPSGAFIIGRLLKAGNQMINKYGEDSELIDAYFKYGSCQKAAEKIGCSWGTIQRTLKRNGIVPNGRKHKGHRGGGSPEKITNDQLIESCKTMTRQEIADKFGMHPDTVTRRCSNLGIHPLYKKDGVSVFNQFKSNPNSDEWHETPNGKDWIDKNTNGEFEFIAYKRKTYKIKCRQCGDITTREAGTIRRYKTTCKKCAEMKKPRERIVNVLKAIAESKKDKICVSCGNVYHSQYSTSKYCSDKCRRKNKRTGGYRERTKKYGVVYMPGISLLKVFNRDNGICQICGCKTDWNDDSWGNGYGAKYPTVDHIKALANGGGHTWDNVQLACAMCNSSKRDLI